ncbi:MFS transporter, partial [Pseudoclavibacter helvolus]|uniref:MFS transporter n=1 Tax=Pseudoclavibacter helvolus TaxID=255205 RepID=UPI000A925E71
SVTGSADGLARIELALWVGAGLALAALVPVVLRTRSGALRPAASSDDAPRASIARVMRTPGVTPQMTASLGLLAMLDILTAFLPLVGEQAGVAPVVVGALLAIRGGASILSRVVLPKLVVRFSRPGLLKASLLGSALALAVPPFVMGHVWLAGLLLAIGGFFLGLGQPLTMSMITTAVPSSWRGSALAVRLMANRLGQVGMPLIAGAVAAPLGPASAIWLSCAVLAASGAGRALRS